MNPHIGSDFDDFLEKEGLVEEVSAAALKRVIAWQIAQAMKSQKVTKKTLAERMQTSRTAVDRALDQNDPGMTLATLASAARALGQRVEVPALHADGHTFPAELAALATAPVRGMQGLAEAVTATTLQRQRALVLQRLRHLGVRVVEARHDQIGTRLLDAYLAIKREGRIG